MALYARYMKAAFFTNNRARLMKQIDGIAVLSAYTGMQRSADMAGPFQQEANFWYLSGIKDPDWILVVDKERSYLIAPDVSEIHRIFDGGLSAEEAKQISGVQEVLTWKEGTNLFKQYAAQGIAVYSLGEDPRSEYYNFSLNPSPIKLEKTLRKVFKDTKDLRRPLLRLRAIKQPEEIEAIRRAVDITKDAFGDIKQRLGDMSHEYDVDAEFTYAFRRHNGTHAYDPIVAGGINACTLHYVQNASALEDSSLLLIDIGIRLDDYPADITRTYAIGEPTERQRDVHAAVEKAQHEIIALLRPGLSLEAYQDSVDVIMKAALDSLGLLKSEDDYRRYFPHAISHGLGVDVHDTLGGYSEFQAGMVLTVEPGIYIPEEKIGVRLEDNIVITEQGNDNLSALLSLSL